MSTKYKGMGLIRHIFGYCPQCGRWFRYTRKKRRRNTAYCEDELNWLYSCRECYEYDCDYFEELWKDYYSGIL